MALLAVVPIAETLRSGQLFGGDWAEYLYSGPAYLHGGGGLYLYPYPMMPVLDLALIASLGAHSIALAQATDVVSGLLIVVLWGAGFLACNALVRHRWAALVGATVLAGFPLYLYEVAWGGQAQLLAYSFGLLAFGVLLSNGIPGRSIARRVVAGLLLTAAAATELYAAAFLLAATALLFLVYLAVQPGRRETFLSMLETLVLPGVVGAALFLTNPSFTHPAGERALWHYWSYGAIWPHLWRALTFQDPLLAEAYVGVLLLYGLYRITFRAPSLARAWVVPVTGVAALGVGFFATPALVADRSLYPLGFPLAFAAADLAACWPSATAVEVPRSFLRTRREEVRWALPVLVVASVAVAGAQLGSDLQLYPVSISGYAFDADSLAQLSWLSGEHGGVVFDSPSARVFQTQWATDRPLFPGPTYQPFYLTSASKQATAVLGTALSYGPRWFDDGNLTITDAEPEWGQPAPGILMFQDAHLYETLESDDFLNLVSYSPTADPGETVSSALFYAPTVTTSESGSVTWVNFTWPDLSASRTVQLLPTGAIEIQYAFDFSQSIPRGVEIYLTSPGKTPTDGAVLSSNATCSGSTVSQTYPGGWIPPIPISFAVGACAGAATLASRYVASDQYGIFELAYDLTPLGSTDRNLTLALTILPSVGGSRHPTLVSEAPVLAAEQIDWVVLDRSSSQIVLQRFMDDPAYTLYRTSPNYLVLTVG